MIFSKVLAQIGPILTRGSALFTLYAGTMIHNEGNEEKVSNILAAMKPLSDDIVKYANQILRDPETMKLEEQSPFNPYSLYQAAAVQRRLWKLEHDKVHEEGFESLQQILGNFTRRWLAAGMLTIYDPDPGFNCNNHCVETYQQALNSEDPPLILPS